MDLPANLFKRAIASAKAPVGTWLMSEVQNKLAAAAAECRK